VLALSLVALLGAAALMVALLGQAVLARQHAETAADLSAIAAASAGDASAATQRAAAVAQSNSAQLTACHRGADGSYTVEVTVALPGLLRRWLPGSVTARARAGQLAGQRPA
jgi:secretion/DNA translocation related TadE-like protein